jgi:hypothetical protein
VYQQLVKLPAGTSLLPLNQLATLPAGLYLVHLTVAGSSQHLKVVKQ